MYLRRAIFTRRASSQSSSQLPAPMFVLRLSRFRRKKQLFLHGFYCYSVHYTDSPLSTAQKYNKQSQIEDEELPLRSRTLSDKQRLMPDRGLLLKDDFYNRRRNYTHYNRTGSARLSEQSICDSSLKGNIDSKPRWSVNRENNLKLPLSRQLHLNADTYFNITSKLARGKLSPETIPINVLPLLPIISERFNDEYNFTVKCLKNWWLTLKDNVGNIGGTALAKAITGLEKLDLKTNGHVLNHISWDEIQNLAGNCLSGVHNKVSSRSFHLLLTTLADFVIMHKQIPSDDLNKSLSDAVQMFFQCERYQYYITTANFYTGFICQKMILLNIDVPSFECLKTIIQTCWVTVKYDYNQQMYKEMEPFFLLVNIFNIIRTFLTWDIDGDKYHEGFWSALFTSVQCLLKNKEIDFRRNNKGRGLVINMFKHFLLVALKFNKIQEFKAVEQFWLELLEVIVMVTKMYPITDNVISDIQFIEKMIRNNENFELFRPVFAKFNTIINEI